MIDADRTRLDAIYNRISQLFEKTFPANAGWRPDIYVSHTYADTNSIEYQTTQMDYMMRAIMASSSDSLRASMKRGLHIKDIVGDEARVILSDCAPSANAKKAERWLAQLTADQFYYDAQLAETRTNLSSAVEAMERFTLVVAERLSRMGVRSDTIHYTMLVPQEQRQFEHLYARIEEMRVHVVAALYDQQPNITDPEAQIADMEQRIRQRIQGNNPTPPHIIHPTLAKAPPAAPVVAFGKLPASGKLPGEPATMEDEPEMVAEAALPEAPVVAEASNSGSAHPLAQSNSGSMYPLHFLQAVLYDPQPNGKKVS